MSEEKKRRRRRDVTNVIIVIASVAGIIAAGGAALTGVLASGAVGNQAAEEAPQAPPAWIGPLKDRINANGFSWIDLAWSDRIATISGQAPDEQAAARGFASAESALRADPVAGSETDLVVNNIRVGGESGLGEAFAALGRRPDAVACQEAFIATLAGRFVGFERGSARITSESAQLLDALSAVAIRCQAHQIEVAGHTDLSGSARDNLLLSMARADAVRSYLIDRNVPADQLSALGYGEEQPIDAGEGAEADARNRRIEFIVRGS